MISSSLMKQGSIWACIEAEAEHHEACPLLKQFHSSSQRTLLSWLVSAQLVVLSCIVSLWVVSTGLHIDFVRDFALLHSLIALELSLWMVPQFIMQQ